MVLISYDISNAREALIIYREKDVVEKGFLALILLSQIDKVMFDCGLYKKIMAMKKLLISLSKLRVQEINGTRILFSLTKDQKGFYEAFGV